MGLYLIFERRKSIQLFAIISSVIVFIAFLIQHFLFTKNIYLQSLGDQFSIEQMNYFLNSQIKYEYLGYILIILFNLIKYLSLTLILQMGLYLRGYEVSSEKVFKVVIISDFVFTFPLIIKFVYFYFFSLTYSLEDVQFSSPLSCLSIFSVHSISKLWLYPLQLFSLFEVLYWCVLSVGLSKLIKSNFSKAFQIVLTSYFPALVIWIIFIMFLTVTLNPA